MDYAFVREVPRSFPHALVAHAKADVDLKKALEQHSRYAQLLVSAGYEVKRIAADEDHPDCPFIEDVVVIVGETAVMTHPGALSRRGEVGPVARAIGELKSLRTIEPPGTLDGGDVLRIGDRLFVGRSSRTNEAGIEQLSMLASEQGLSTTPALVSNVLHLKSAVSLIGDDTVLVAPDCVDMSAFADFRVIEKNPRERHLASTLQLKDGVVHMTATAPLTADRVSAAGFQVQGLDMSEFQAVDGGLTCLSVLLSAD